jgi:hypothetical protein
MQTDLPEVRVLSFMQRTVTFYSLTGIIHEQEKNEGEQEAPKKH